ncbi:MAG: hypothetical protein V1834_00170 [Candidatus Micrarchaeota archaeon]
MESEEMSPPPLPPHKKGKPPKPGEYGHPLPHQPPHLRDKQLNKSVLLKSVLVGTALTLIVGLILFFAGIKIEVVLPVIAPVWVGSITLLYNHWKHD